MHLEDALGGGEIVCWIRGSVSVHAYMSPLVLDRASAVLLAPWMLVLGDLVSAQTGWSLCVDIRVL